MDEADEPESEERPNAIDHHPRRFTMKSLGAIVDANRLKSGTERERQNTGPVARASKLHGGASPGASTDASDDTSETPPADKVAGAEGTGEARTATPRARPTRPLRRDNLHATVAARRKEEAQREAEREEEQAARVAEQREFEARQAAERRDARLAERKARAELGVLTDATPAPTAPSTHVDPPAMTPSSDKARSKGADVDLTAPTTLRSAAPLDRLFPEDAVAADGVDRSDMGGTVTRTGLSSLVGTPRFFEERTPASVSTLASEQPLARQILDEEIAPGGRVSDPHDINGVVLNLAKDLPAATAVSVVRVEEEVELVGHTIDPDVDASSLANVFSGVFRAMQITAGVFTDGPLGKVNDVVIEGENLDLVLRTLGPHYYLMVLEDRHHPAADLARTRMLMGTLAPGLTAILAHRYGET